MNTSALNIETYWLKCRQLKAAADALTKHRPIKRCGRQTDLTARHLLSIFIRAEGEAGTTWPWMCHPCRLSGSERSMKPTTCWSHDFGCAGALDWKKKVQKKKKVQATRLEFYYTRCAVSSLDVSGNKSEIIQHKQQTSQNGVSKHSFGDGINANVFIFMTARHQWDVAVMIGIIREDKLRGGQRRGER